MNLDVLRLRRPKIDYVSPPVCEGTFSGSGSVTIVLDPFTRNRITGVVISDDGNGNLIVSWPDFPGAVCYNVYEQLPDGTLVLIGECVECCEFPIPPDLDDPTIVITPIDDDGEGDPSDPVRPPDGPPGGDPCEPFIDDMGIIGLGNFFGTSNSGIVGGSTPTGLSGMYFDRVGGAVRTTRSSSPIQGSQAASDLVNSTSDFFLPGDVGKFLRFSSGGDSREILMVIGPTQVQVDTIDTVALSTFTVHGGTIGGQTGNMSVAGDGNHLAGNEATPDGLGQMLVWYDHNTGIMRGIATGFEYIPVQLSVDGFFLYWFNDAGGSAFIYNPNTESSTLVTGINTPYDMNDSLTVVGTFTDVPHDPGFPEDQRAAKWQAGVLTDIEPADSISNSVLENDPAGNASRLFINNSGMIVGEYLQNQFDMSGMMTSNTVRTRTFVNLGGASTSIGHYFVGSPSEGEIYPTALSDSGIAVGSASIDASEHFRGWKWSVATGLVQLQPLPGHTTCSAEAVNDAGLIVGVSQVAPAVGGTACVWFPGETVPVSLISLLPEGHGWTELIQADHVTNDNEITGSGIIGIEGTSFFVKLCLD